MKNSFGHFFCMTSFGESHGDSLGVVIDGCPAGVDFGLDKLKTDLARRRPGGLLVSGRREGDEPHVLSGVFAQKTLGTPIAITVQNKDQRSSDYDELLKEPRKGHADDTWRDKFAHVDHRGGGRSSGRETVARVMAGSVAEMFLSQEVPDFHCAGYAVKIGSVAAKNFDRKKLNRSEIDQIPARFADASMGQEVEDILVSAKAEGQSYGGVVELVLRGVPSGLGQPAFHKLKADLATAMLSIGATTGFEIGAGFSSAEISGTDFHGDDETVYGGIRGGISTGEDILLRVGFKPTSSIMDFAKRGRHDPCIVTRAIPVMEAMASLVIADHILWKRGDRV